jgi:hypothetical protein
MKRLVVIALFVMLIPLVTMPSDVEATENITIYSGTSTLYWDGDSWENAVKCWEHSAWTSLKPDSNSDWIWSSYYTDSSKVGTGEMLEFKVTFNIPSSTGINGNIGINADNGYQVYSNGVLIGQDGRTDYWNQNPDLQEWATVLDHSLTGNLVTGSNEILIKAYNYAMPGGTPTSNPAALVFKIDVNYEPHISASIEINPDTLNLKSKGNWATAYIELPTDYDPANIDLSTVLLQNSIPAITDTQYLFVTDPTVYLVDHDGDGITERMVKFSRADMISLINGMDYADDTGAKKISIPLTVSGMMTDGTSFDGQDMVVTIHK